MISISTPTFDLSGTLMLHKTQSSEVSQRTRRVNRSATLDGGAVLTDSGYSDADRTFEIIETGASRHSHEVAKYLIENYTTVIVSSDEGVFSGALRDISMDEGDMVILFFVSEKIGG